MQFLDVHCSSTTNCAKCKRPVDSDCILCEGPNSCQRWFHRPCVGLQSGYFKHTGWLCGIAPCSAVRIVKDVFVLTRFLQKRLEEEKQDSERKALRDKALQEREDETRRIRDEKARWEREKEQKKKKEEQEAREAKEREENERKAALVRLHNWEKESAKVIKKRIFFFSPSKNKKQKCTQTYDRQRRNSMRLINVLRI